MVGFHVPSWMVDKMKALMDSQHTNKLSKFNQSTDIKNESFNDEVLASKKKDDKNDDDNNLSLKESDFYGKLIGCDYDNDNDKVTNREISKSDLTPGMAYNRINEVVIEGEDD